MNEPASKSEAARLGKRGSYRLGAMYTAGLPEGPSPRPLRPWFGRPPRRGPAGPWIAAAAVGTALIGLGAAAGLWFLPFLVGLAAGLTARRGGWRLRVTLPATLVMAVAGWGIVLWVQAGEGLPVGATARTIAALAGLPAARGAGFGLALAVSVILSLTGLWLGRALTPFPDRTLPAANAVPDRPPARPHADATAAQGSIGRDEHAWRGHREPR